MIMNNAERDQTRAITRIKKYSVLHVAFLIYALSMLIMKLASAYSAFSKMFILFYILSVAVMGIYALLWQQILKGMPLTIAYSNKSITVFWGMLIGLLVFNEVITLKKIMAAALIVVGIILIAREN